MAPKARKRQHTDAATSHAPPETLRDRVRREYDEAVRRLRGLGGPDLDNADPLEAGAPVVEEGDTAQANAQQEMTFATRQRLSGRVKRLALALERIEAGTYGTCSVCGEPIEPARLAVMPEADACVRCQAEIERAARRQVA